MGQVGVDMSSNQLIQKIDTMLNGASELSIENPGELGNRHRNIDSKMIHLYNMNILINLFILEDK